MRQNFAMQCNVNTTCVMVIGVMSPNVINFMISNKYMNWMYINSVQHI